MVGLHYCVAVALVVLGCLHGGSPVQACPETFAEFEEHFQECQEHVSMNIREDELCGPMEQAYACAEERVAQCSSARWMTPAYTTYFQRYLAMIRDARNYYC